MNIRLANIADKNKWDEYVLDHSGASPYHLFGWKSAIEDAYNHKGYYLIAEDNNQIKGVFPLIHLKPPLLSGKLVSLPFCDLGGPLINDDKLQDEIVKEAVLLARKLKVKYIDLRNQEHFMLSQGNDLPVNTQSHKVRMLLELPSSSELLWDNFKSKLRSQIRRSEKNGLSFSWGNLENLDDFYLVFSRNMKELGSPTHSKEWFKSILKHYGEKVHMGLVYYDNKPVGCGIILNTHNIVSIPWASTLREYNRLSPNMLLYWNFLKYSADNKFAQFDFGRSTMNEGTFKFKAQWGAGPVPLYWNYIIMNGKELSFDTATSAKREMIEQLWQKLPLSLANRIGPAIRKHISL